MHKNQQHTASPKKLLKELLSPKFCTSQGTIQGRHSEMMKFYLGFYTFTICLS